MIAERRGIRRFRPDPVPDEVLERPLRAAHHAPSVGLMQPWRLIVIRDIGTPVEADAEIEKAARTFADAIGAAEAGI